MWGFLCSREGPRPTRTSPVTESASPERGQRPRPAGGHLTSPRPWPNSPPSPSASSRAAATAPAGPRPSRRLPELAQGGDWEARFGDWGFAREKAGTGPSGIKALAAEVPTVRLRSVRSATDFRPASSTAARPRWAGSSPRAEEGPNAQGAARPSTGTVGSWCHRQSTPSGGQPGQASVFRKPRSITIHSIPDRIVDIQVVMAGAEAGAKAGVDPLGGVQLARLFGFLCRGSELAPGAERFIRGALRDLPRLEEESLRGEPSPDAGLLLPLSASRVQQLRAVLQLYAQVLCPVLFPLTHAAGDGDRDKDELGLPKLAFCRFLLDSRLLSEVGEGPSGARSYHRATRLYDAVAHMPQGRNASSPTSSPAATLDQSVNLVRYLLGERASNEKKDEFFQEGLPEAQLIVQALLDKSEECALAARETASKPQQVGARMQLERDPPAHFHGSVKEWCNGISLWQRTMEEQGENTVQRVEQQFALACYISDMLIDPGSLHVCSVFGDLFRDIFQEYCDSERTYNVEAGGVVRVKHMSFASFFRFCLDFSVFPELCSFDEARVAYASAECLCNPEDPEPAPPGRRLTVLAESKLGRLSKRRSAAPSSPKAPRTPEASQTPNESRRSSLTFCTPDPTMAFPEDLDLAWITKDFGRMSQRELGAYRLLSTLRDCAGDHFLSVRALFARDGSEGVVGTEEVLSVLDRWRVEHSFDSQDVLAFVHILTPGGIIRVLDLEKAVCLVHADERKRRPRFVDPTTSRNSINNVTALGNEARRLDDEGARPHGRGDTSSAPAFGHTAFMECLMRICFRHLHGSGLEVKTSMPPSLKTLWLVTFIHFQFDRLLQAHRSAPPAGKDLRDLRSRKTLASLSDPLRLSLGRASALRKLTTLEINDSCEDLRIGDAQYSSCLARLLDAHPDLFQRYLADGDAGQDGMGPTAAERCATCGRCRDRRGVGSPLCHACSGIDDRPLSASPMRAIIERWRLFRPGS